MTRTKRCRSCQRPVRWARTNANRIIKLDARPGAGGDWALDNETGRAWRPPTRHLSAAVWRNHRCKDTP